VVVSGAQDGILWGERRKPEEAVAVAACGVGGGELGRMWGGGSELPRACSSGSLQSAERCSRYHSVDAVGDGGGAVDCCN